MLIADKLLINKLIGIWDKKSLRHKIILPNMTTIFNEVCMQNKGQRENNGLVLHQYH